MRASPRRSGAVIGMVVVLAACAPVSGTAAGARFSGPITRGEVEASSQSDAYRLVYRARPGWLRARSPIGIGVNGVAAIRAYVDQMPVGSVEYLKQVPISIVDSVIFLSGTEATQRFGTNNGNGAILVTTRS